MRNVTVTVDGRKFRAQINNLGEVTVIKERRIHAKGKPYEAAYDAPIWHHSNAVKSHRPNSLTGRVRAAIDELMKAT